MKTNKHTNKTRPHTRCGRMASTWTSLNNLQHWQTESSCSRNAGGDLESAVCVENHPVLEFTASERVFGAERQRTASAPPSDPNLWPLKLPPVGLSLFWMSNRASANLPPHLSTLARHLTEQWSWLDRGSGRGRGSEFQAGGRSEVDAFDQRRFQSDWEVVERLQDGNEAVDGGAVPEQGRVLVHALNDRALGQQGEPLWNQSISVEK